jgi:hypothetical protein
VILLVGAVAGALVLVGLLGNLVSPTVTRPTLVLSSADESGGNATLTVALATQRALPESYRFRAQANVTIGEATPLPPSGTSTVVGLGSTSLRVSWADADVDGFVSEWDRFLVTGDGGPLPTSTAFWFTLLWSDGSLVASTGWST